MLSVNYIKYLCSAYFVFPIWLQFSLISYRLYFALEIMENFVATDLLGNLEIFQASKLTNFLRISNDFPNFLFYAVHCMSLANKNYPPIAARGTEQEVRNLNTKE